MKMHSTVLSLVAVFAGFGVVLPGCGESADSPDAVRAPLDSPGVPETPSPASAGPVAVSAVSTAAGSDDWPWWRGPNFNGIANDGGRPPVSWSENENVVWKSPIPGRGHSSPTVVGNRIFLATADQGSQVQSVLAFDRRSGQEIWKVALSRGGFPPIHRKNTQATCTLACDGQQLFVAFAHHDAIHVTALTLDGEKIWSRNAGVFTPQQYKYGFATSPLLYKSTVIVAADSDSGGWIAALDVRTGKDVWRTPRPRKLSFSSPIVARVAGRDQLLISGCETVSSFDPTSGREIWSVSATTMATCGTMVWDGDLVFASGGYPKKETVCVDARTGKIVWRNVTKCYEQSMLAVDGYIYAVDDSGVAHCWRARDGEETWSRRLRGPVSASPILANGNIYLSNEYGTTYVFRANPQSFEGVSENRLGSESFATMSICGDLIYTRVAFETAGGRQEYLYCLGAATGE